MSTNSFKTNPKRLVLNATLIITQQLFLYRPPSDYPVRGVAQKNRCSCSSSTVTLVHFALYYLWRKVFVTHIPENSEGGFECFNLVIFQIILKSHSKQRLILGSLNSE